MTKRKEYKEPGWERQPVSWSFSVAFKKPRGKRLIWVSTESQNEVAASKEANSFMEKRYPGEGYIEYGISKTYWRHWAHYSTPITQEDYEYALSLKR